MNFSNFDKITGRLKSSTTVPDDYVIPPSDDIIILGKFDGARHYVNLDTGLVEDAGAAPSAFHVLSGTDGWVLNTDAAESATRAHRDTLLMQSDWVEFPSAKTRMSNSILNSWLEYRQQLRNIPSQEGFPLTVSWPSAPK